MTQALKDLWKKNFPAWPDALIEKFQNEIFIQANQFDEAYGKESREFYLQKTNFDKSIYYTDLDPRFLTVLSILNPTNPQFTKIETWSPGARYIYVGMFPYSYAYSMTDPTDDSTQSSGGPVQKQYVKPSCKFVWDIRLFGSQFDPRWNVIYGQNGDPFNISYLSMMSYDYMKVLPIWTKFSFGLANPALPYKQAESVIVLFENGQKMQGVDYSKLYDFVSYLKAYQNSEQQIISQSVVAKKTAEADLQNYRGDLDSKLLAQKNALQNLTLQLTTQTQGQADSVRRDMQQLNLQAVGLKLQILGLMKK